MDIALDDDVAPARAIDGDTFPRAEVARVLALRHRDVVSHFRALADVVGERTALTFLELGEEPGAALSFAQLDRQARSIGAHLQRRDAGGARAVLLFDPGVDSMAALLGCVYGGAIAVPLPALSSARPDRYLQRVRNVMVDGEVRLVLTTSTMRRRLESIASEFPAFSEITWLEVDTLPDLSASWRQKPADPDDVVYLQYTSGSTSTPKGVMITHRNLMSVIVYNGDVTGCAEYGTGNVCWMPYYHDYAMIDGLLVPMAHGMSVWLMSPFDFVNQPVRWLRAIARFRATHSSGPNFSFDLAVRKSTAQERAALDLSCWRRANNTAEPVRAGTMRRFLEAFGPCGVHADTLSPAFALAETTLLVTVTRAPATIYSVDAAELACDRAVLRPEGGPGTRELVGCGRLWPNEAHLDVQVVDPRTCALVPENGVGEVWISGDLVAAGYWNRPADTQEKFHATIADLPGRRYLRTGDLGFWFGDELVITGRHKDLIIVEGRNHYPQDIEASADAAFPALRPGCTIAFSTESDEGQVHTVLVCELRPEFRLVEAAPPAGAALGEVVRADLERAIRRAVAEEHQIRLREIVVLPAGLLPKTTSGKLERRGCRALYLRGALFDGVPRRL